jgi:flagellar hook-associated protein 3 FlgL
MRISSNRVFDNSLIAINAASERLNRANLIVSSGKQLNQPSDDPAGFVQALDLQTSLDNFDQYAQNINSARSFIGAGDNALSDATNLIRQARTLAIQAASDTLNDQDRQAIAGQIDSIIKQLGTIANTTYGSRSVFGGQRTTQPPFKAENGSYTYQGGQSATGDDRLTVEIGPGDTMVINATGDNLFGAAFAALSRVRDDVSMNRISAISGDDLDALDAATGPISKARADFGAKTQQLDQTQTRLDSMKTNFADYLSRIQDADLPTAMLNLRTAETAYQAALTAAAHGFQQSLMDFLK